MRHRLTGLVACIAAATALVWWAYPYLQPAPRVRRIGSVRPVEITLHRIQSMDLRWDGIPFGSEVHQVISGKPVRVSGSVPLHADRIPSGIILPKIVFSHYPVGSPEEVWVGQNSRAQKSVGLLGRDQHFDVTKTYAADLYPPGNYDVRAYLHIRDMEGEDDVFEHIARGQMQILPAAAASAP